MNTSAGILSPAARSEWRLGWHSVLVAGIGSATGPAFYQYVSSLFIPSIEASFGWSRADTTAVAAIPFIGAFSAPLIGRLADRYGIRLVASICIVMVGLSYIGLMLTSGAFWQIAGLMVVLGLFAPGATGLTYGRAVVSWFNRGRGLAIGITTSVITIFTAALAPAIATIIAEHGFRAGNAVLASLILLVGLPVILLGLKERDTPVAEQSRPAPPKGNGAGFLALSRQPQFRLLAVTLLILNIPTGGVLTQLGPLVISRGIAADQAGFMLSLYAASVLVGRLVIGWLFDKYPAQRVTAVATLIAAFGCVAFTSAAPVAALFLGVLTVGLIQGAETDINTYFVGRMFPHSEFSSVFGGILASAMIGTAIGVIGFGQLFEASGDYDSAMLTSVILLFVAAGLFLMLAPYMSRTTFEPDDSDGTAQTAAD